MTVLFDTEQLHAQLGTHAYTALTSIIALHTMKLTVTFMCQRRSQTVCICHVSV